MEKAAWSYSTDGPVDMNRSEIWTFDVVKCDAVTGHIRIRRATVSSLFPVLFLRRIIHGAEYNRIVVFEQCPSAMQSRSQPVWNEDTFRSC